MTYKLVLTDEAKKEIEQAYDWYEKQQEGLGKRFLDCVEEAYALILDFPFGYPARRKDYRECFLGRFPFVVIYRSVKNQVVIYKVFHTSRNPTRKRLAKK